MIEFSCPHCGRSMRVADEHAGKKGKCKDCGNPVGIPQKVEVSPEFTARKKAAIHNDEIDDDLPPIRTRVPARRSSSEVRQVPSVVVPNQVNVSVTTPRSNGTALAGLILGIVALFVFWMPFVGFGIAAVGFLLAGIGLLVSLMRGGTGIGYALGGLAVSFAALLAGSPATLFTAAVVAGVDKSVREAQARPADNNPPAKPAAQNAAAKPPAAAAAPVPPKVLATIGQPVQVGDFSITVEKAARGKVGIKNAFGKGLSESEHLEFIIRVENTSPAKKLNYIGWNMPNFIPSRAATLTDDVGNTYRQVRPSIGDKFADGGIPETSIYPNKSTGDAIVFEVPVDAAKSLQLKLPGETLGIKGDFEFSIPVGQIVHK